MTNVIMFGIIVLNEAICFLVDGIVGEMHAKIVQIASHGTVIRFGGESGQTLFVDEAA